MKKVNKYPNRFNKYADMPKYLKNIIKDRGPSYRYKAVVIEEFVPTIVSCMLPNGIVLSGLSYVHPTDTYDVKKGLKVAAKQLEKSITHLEKQQTQKDMIDTDTPVNVNTLNIYL